MKTLNDRSVSKNPYLKIFILGFLTALCMLLPFLVIDKGFFLYAGDFNSQQIPFYMNAVRAVQQGNLNWSWNTDLGGSLVGCYSFYLMGSPFFWVSCLFPYKWIPYMMPVGLILKFALAALGAFCYLRRYAKNDNFASLGAILYAFCGFGIYDIFFNHFLESFAFFPFLLWSLDEFVYSKRRGPFVFWVGLNLINNYFFFIGQVVFLLIYFICKITSREYIIKLKEFFLLAFESVLGCMCGIALLIPSVLSILQNPRSTQMFEDFGFWVYNRPQQYLQIIMSAFFPPDIPYEPTLFTECNVKWTSMTAFVVLGGMFGFFIFFRWFKNSAFTKIFFWCIVFALVPVLNSSFYAFNNNYYARWFYMPVLVLVAMNMHSFTLCKQKIYYGLKVTAVVTAAFCVFGLTPTTDKEGQFKLGLQNETPLFWLMLAVALLSIYVTFVLVYNFRDKKHYSRNLIMGALSLVMVYSMTHISLAKIPQLDNDANYIEQNYDIIDSFDLNDDGRDFRMDAYKCYNNIGLYINKPVIHFFNSTVTPSILEFYPYVGVKRDVSSKPEYTNYALRSLLSVKYAIMPHHEYESFCDEEYDKTYLKHGTTGPYTVLKNEYFIPMGFTYDKYIVAEDAEHVAKVNRAKLFLRAIMVDETVVDRYKLGLEQLDHSETTVFTFERFEQDVNNRKAESSYFFEMTNDGFISKIKLSENNLVFYSVPYDEGFTAFVNGIESEIIKVNSGLCAVYAPAGDNEIMFTYQTPGLKTGIILNLCGLGIYTIYILLIKKKKVKI